MKMIIVGLLLAVLLFGCLQSPDNRSRNETQNTKPQQNADTANAITEAMCRQYGGNWNECGSACRGQPPGTACTMQCVPMCECGGIAGFRCPPGYSCTDYLPSSQTPDAMGLCKRVST